MLEESVAPLMYLPLAAAGLALITLLIAGWTTFAESRVLWSLFIVATLGFPFVLTALGELVRKPGEMPLRQYRREQERTMVVEALAATRWNVSAAARRLGLSRVGLSNVTPICELVADRLPENFRPNWTDWLSVPSVIVSLIVVPWPVLNVSLPVTPIQSRAWRFASTVNGDLIEELGWPELTREVARIYATIPPDERPTTGIFGNNYGEAGVCWRLASDLASRGERGRLWVDDPTALSWMAPAGAPGVDVVRWTDPAPEHAPGDVERSGAQSCRTRRLTGSKACFRPDQTRYRLGREPRRGRPRFGRCSGSNGWRPASHACLRTTGTP